MSEQHVPRRARLEPDATREDSMTDQPRILGGRYEIGRVIGRGGMALVSQARDLRLGRDVAVKELRIDLAGDPTFQERFRREAQAAAGLNHPNIVAVYDTGEELDPQTRTHVPYIVMELVEGRTLRDILREGRPILPQRALEFTAGVLDALAYSHKAGIIHRDIKPANVMLTTTGTVKVMDFGIARAVSDTSSTMTQTAAVIGTAQYLSPEQARGESVDARSDIYSTGCLLYELLVGRPPFQGDSPVSVAYQHVRERPVPPSQLDPEVTSAMDAVVLKALAKNPDDRYATAEDMRDDVTRILEGRPVMATPPLAGVGGTTVNQPTEVLATVSSPLPPASEVAPEEDAAAVAEEEKPKSRARLWWTIAIVALVVIGAIATFLLMQQRDAGPKQIQVPPLTNQTQAQAESSLQALGLMPVVENFNGSNDATVGRVTQTDPVAGTTVSEGSKVTLRVNVGPKMIQIPTGLTGLAFDDAKQRLVSAGFNAASITPVEAQDEPSTAKAGSVVKVSPAEGSQAAATDIITVSVATGRASVPYVRGMTYDNAVAELKTAGFTKITREDQVSSDPDLSPGQVITTRPGADTRLDKTATVTIIVAKAASSPSPSPTSSSPSASPTSSPTSTTP